MPEHVTPNVGIFLCVPFISLAKAHIVISCFVHGSSIMKELPLTHPPQLNSKWLCLLVKHKGCKLHKPCCFTWSLKHWTRAPLEELQSILSANLPFDCTIQRYDSHLWNPYVGINFHMNALWKQQWSSAAALPHNRSPLRHQKWLVTTVCWNSFTEDIPPNVCLCAQWRWGHAVGTISRSTHLVPFLDTAREKPLSGLVHTTSL